MNTERKSLTAAELIELLSALPQDTVIKAEESDSEWSMVYVWAIAGVTPSGTLIHGGILDSYSSWPEDTEDDE